MSSKKNLEKYLGSEYYNENSDFYLTNKKDFNEIIRKNSRFKKRGSKSDNFKLKSLISDVDDSYNDKKALEVYLQNLYEKVLRLA